MRFSTVGRAGLPPRHRHQFSLAIHRHGSLPRALRFPGLLASRAHPGRPPDCQEGKLVPLTSASLRRPPTF